MVSESTQTALWGPSVSQCLNQLQVNRSVTADTAGFGLAPPFKAWTFRLVLELPGTQLSAPLLPKTDSPAHLNSLKTIGVQWHTIVLD